MVSSNLSLEVLKDNNIKTLTVIDTSFYFDSVENLLLEVLSPTASTWKTYKVNPSFILTLNASSLGLCQVTSAGQLPDLQDGIYELGVSYKPNFSTQVKYLHFYMKNILKTYYSSLESLYSSQCSISNREFEESRDILIRIKMDIDAAKWMVEVEHKKEEGKTLYEKIQEDLKKYNNECGCS